MITSLFKPQKLVGKYLALLFSISIKKFLLLSLYIYIVPSGPPRNLATADVTSRSISLTWDPPIAANRNGIIRTYIISAAVQQSKENIQLMSNSTQINLELLHPYYTYSFVISAVTIGPGPPSSAYNVTTDEEGM